MIESSIIPVNLKEGKTFIRKRKRCKKLESVKDLKITEYFSNKKFLLKNLKFKENLEVVDEEPKLSSKTLEFIDKIDKTPKLEKEKRDKITLDTLSKISLREKYENLLTRNDFILPTTYELLYKTFAKIDEQIIKGDNKLNNYCLDDILKCTKVMPNCFLIDLTNNLIQIGQPINAFIRMSLFRENLVKLVKMQHEDFIEEKGISLGILPYIYEYHTWHSDFDLEKCSEI